jgi:hypothetical protein
MKNDFPLKRQLEDQKIELQKEAKLAQEKQKKEREKQAKLAQQKKIDEL